MLLVCLSNEDNSINDGAVEKEMTFIINPIGYELSFLSRVTTVSR